MIARTNAALWMSNGLPRANVEGNGLAYGAPPGEDQRHKWWFRGDLDYGSTPITIQDAAQRLNCPLRELRYWVTVRNQHWTPSKLRDLDQAFRADFGL